MFRSPTGQAWISQRQSNHGGYQQQMESIARRLNGEWAGSGQRVHYFAAYYRAASIEFAQALREQGLSSAQIGTHAGVADTSLTLALSPEGVRSELLHAAPPLRSI